MGANAVEVTGFGFKVGLKVLVVVAVLLLLFHGNEEEVVVAVVLGKGLTSAFVVVAFGVLHELNREPGLLLLELERLLLPMLLPGLLVTLLL